MATENKCNVAVIGGGVAGITAANELSKNKAYEITIFESSQVLGGLNQSVELDNLVYDIGAFIYAEDHSLLKTFPFLKDTYLPIMHYPITIKGKNIHDIHPLSLKGYWKNFGTLNLIYSIISLLLAKLKYSNHSTLPEYCKYYLGSRVYSKSGLQRYIKRLYKIDDTKVDMKLGYSRIKNLSRYSLRNIIGRITKLKTDNLFNAKKRKFYVRPQEGFTAVFERLEKHLTDNKININKNVKIESISKVTDSFLLNTSDESFKFDRIISTIPLSITQKLIGLETNFRPSYMSLVTLFYKAECLFDANVIYNYTKYAEWKRITVYSKYYGLHEGRDYFSVEVTVSGINDSTVDTYRQEFETQAEKYAIAKNLEFQGSKIIPFAYPVFYKGETELADKELEKIQDFGLDLVGRQGTFEFLSSDETISSTQEYIREAFS